MAPPFAALGLEARRIRAVPLRSMERVTLFLRQGFSVQFLATVTRCVPHTVCIEELSRDGGELLQDYKVVIGQNVAALDGLAVKRSMAHDGVIYSPLVLPSTVLRNARLEFPLYQSGVQR